MPGYDLPIPKVLRLLMDASGDGEAGVVEQWLEVIETDLDDLIAEA